MNKIGIYIGIATMGLLGLLVLFYLVGRISGLTGLNYLPAGSMTPTLPKGSYVFTALMPYWFHPPQRGDIITFTVPLRKNVLYIKRIVGLPGDRVQMHNGQLVLNGTQIAQKKVEDWPRIDRLQSYLQRNLVFKKVPQFEEVLPSGLPYRVLDFRKNSSLDDTRIYLVPKDHYFVLGDNRDNSLDSRSPLPVGFVPRKNIRGKLLARLTWLEPFGILTKAIGF